MKNKKLLLITSLIILLPCLVGVYLWELLPDNMPTHFGASGIPDGWSSKGFTVFGMPLILLAVQLGIYFGMKLDKQNQTGGNRKVLDIIFCFFMPAVSLLNSASVYAAALSDGRGSVNLNGYVSVFLGLLFVAVGNYMPKCRQNSTLGIKLPWTFHNEENWNKTHRISGMVWVIGGVAIILSGLLGWMWGVLLAAIPMLLIPTLYSYLLYKKQIASGAYQPGDPQIVISPYMKRASWSIILVVILILGLVLFAGEIDYTMMENSLSIRTGRWMSTSIYLGQDVTVEYHAEGIEGTRVWGFGSPRLSLGEFSNEEISYTRYTYNGCTPCILIRTEFCIYVINDRTPEATRALYEEILAVIG